MARHFRIHPAIGTARMGNSPEHFIGPETSGVPANWDDATQSFKSFRDSAGRILRQAARFRVFEYDEDASGALSNPREVTLGADILDIEWRVHLANRKASFFVFNGQDGAEDIYVKRSLRAPTERIKEDPDRANLRNPEVPTGKREDLLDIDPGEQLISQSQRGPVELINQKQHIPIQSLGTLLDDNGRLIVLGGYGESNSTDNPPRQIDEYASNDTWFDDASDGTIKARIILKDGPPIDADPAWVFVGPPDFAPPIGNVVRLLDTLEDTAVRELALPPGPPATPALGRISKLKQAWQANGGKSLAGFTPSFMGDIYPLLKRALGARDVHTSGVGNENYHRSSMLHMATLSAVDGPLATDGAGLRQLIFSKMRNPDASAVEWDAMPRGLGDDYTALDNFEDDRDNNPPPTPRSFLSLTRIQYAMLAEWAKGNFTDPWPGQEPRIVSNPNPTPDDLDRAATENSVGGPFYPGIEVSWLIRVKELFSEPFRLKVPPLTVGALELRPGFFSQQMALPWQADFYDCHKEDHDDPDGNKFFFMWWTAQRPDDVFPSGKTQQERWVRDFDKSKTTEDPDDLKNLERFNQMQRRWFELKFITVKRGDHFEEEP